MLDLQLGTLSSSQLYSLSLSVWRLAPVGSGMALPICAWTYILFCPAPRLLQTQVDISLVWLW